jgi:signal transduction histidine kinase
MAEAMLGFAPRCHVDADVDGLVSEEVAPEVLAVVRMALTNIGRDAQATQVDVSLRVDGDMVSIEVIGNGHDTGPMEQHSDVVDMRSRAERLNGTMDIGHIDGGGTCLTWRVPVGEM